MQTSEHFSLPPFVRDHHLTLNREKGRPTVRVIFFIHQNTYLIIIQNPYVLLAILASSSSIYCLFFSLWIFVVYQPTNHPPTSLINNHQSRSCRDGKDWAQSNQQRANITVCWSSPPGNRKSEGWLQLQPIGNQDEILVVFHTDPYN